MNAVLTFLAEALCLRSYVARPDQLRRLLAAAGVAMLGARALRASLAALERRGLVVVRRAAVPVLPPERLFRVAPGERWDDTVCRNISLRARQRWTEAEHELTDVVFATLPAMRIFGAAEQKAAVSTSALGHDLLLCEWFVRLVEEGRTTYRRFVLDPGFTERQDREKQFDAAVIDPDGRVEFFLEATGLYTRDRVKDLILQAEAKGRPLVFG